MKGYGRFSAYIKAQQQYRCGGYDCDGYGDDGHEWDGVDKEDRDTGPLEMYSAERCADWVFVERVVKGSVRGRGGMVFRDREGGWHFVADV